MFCVFHTQHNLQMQNQASTWSINVKMNVKYRCTEAGHFHSHTSTLLGVSSAPLKRLAQIMFLALRRVSNGKMAERAGALFAALGDNDDRPASHSKQPNHLHDQTSHSAIARYGICTLHILIFVVHVFVYMYQCRVPCKIKQHYRRIL